MLSSIDARFVGVAPQATMHKPIESPNTNLGKFSVILLMRNLTRSNAGCGSAIVLTESRAALILGLGCELNYLFARCVAQRLTRNHVAQQQSMRSWLAF
jgi:hypothetical protein